METRTVYYTPPAKSYRVLYNSISSAISGIGYAPTLEGIRSMIEKWRSTHGDSARWAIQHGSDGQWETTENFGYFSA